MFLVRCDVPLVNTLNKREQPVDDVWSTVQALRCCPSQPAPPWPDVLSGLPWRTDGKQPLNDGNVPRWRCFEGCRRLRGNICNARRRGIPTRHTHKPDGLPTAWPHQRMCGPRSNSPTSRSSHCHAVASGSASVHTQTHSAARQSTVRAHAAPCNRGSSIHTVPRHRASARARFR